MNKRTRMHRFDRKIWTERIGKNALETIDLTLKLGLGTNTQECIDLTVKCGQSEQEQTYRNTLI